MLGYWMHLAADATSGGIDVNIFAQYGVLGVAVFALGWFAKGAYANAVARGDRLEEDNRRLNQAIQDRVIPALTESTLAAQEATRVLREERDHGPGANRRARSEDR